MTNLSSLDELNLDPTLDYPNSLNSLLNSDNDNPYNLYNIHSKYYDNPAFLKSFKNSKNNLLLSLNIQSLHSKHFNLKSFIIENVSSGVPISLIALQEIWNIVDPNTVNIPNFNFVYKKRSKFRGGGVGFYIKQGISYKIIENLSFFVEKIFECLTIELTINSKKITICNIYRSPSPLANQTPAEHLDSFFVNFENLMSELSTLNQESYIFMDSNINLLNVNQNNSPTHFIESSMQHGFIQTVSKATRIFNNQTSLIDHIFTNSKNSKVETGVIINDISDHFITFIQPQLSPIFHPNKPTLKQDMSRPKMEKFRSDLGRLGWQNVLACSEVDESYELFWKDFKALYDLHFPLKQVKFNKNIHSINKFMTRGLLISRATKNNLLKTNAANRTTESLESYKIYRNIYNKILRASKKLYYKESFIKNRKNPKKIWELIKEVSTGTKSTHPIEKIKANGKIITDKVEIAENFNTFFAEIGKQISDSVLPTDKKAEDYLPVNPNTPKLKISNTGPLNVVDVLKAFEPKKSLDLDGLSMELLKFVAVEISRPLAHIFNLSINSGWFPSALKRSRTVPIHKGGDAELCDNYRPISLQNSIAKILEKMVATQLVNHLELNNLLYKHQYGFLRGKSTEHNLLHLTNKIGKALNEGNFVISLFLDLKKAFDVCSHDILLMKLSKLGIVGKSLDWFTSYLKNRVQHVDIDGNVSSPKNINISVLQGSILGPILFLCYINDLPNATDLLTFLFADDTSGLIIGKNLQELVLKMNSEINKLANWFRANKMAVNISKTKYLIFHTKGKKIENFDDNSIVFDENEIGKPKDPALITPLGRIFDSHPAADQRSYKLLGVLFDETLSFKHHVNFLVNKLSKSLFCLNRAKNFLDPKALKMLYFSLIHSNLIYCIGPLSTMSSSNANKILKIQKKAIRSIAGAKSREPSTPLFQNLKILPYNLLQKQAKLHFMHSVEYKYAPSSFQDTWQKNEARNLNYELRNNDLYTIPKINLVSLNNIPFFSYPAEWNSLGDLRFQNNKITFQINLKYNLLEELSPAIPYIPPPPPLPPPPPSPSPSPTPPLTL